MARTMWPFPILCNIGRSCSTEEKKHGINEMSCGPWAQWAVSIPSMNHNCHCSDLALVKRSICALPRIFYIWSTIYGCKHHSPEHDCCLVAPNFSQASVRSNSASYLSNRATIQARPILLEKHCNIASKRMFPTHWDKDISLFILILWSSHFWAACNSATPTATVNTISILNRSVHCINQLKSGHGMSESEIILQSAQWMFKSNNASLIICLEGQCGNLLFIYFLLLFLLPQNVNTPMTIHLNKITGMHQKL